MKTINRLTSFAILMTIFSGFCHALDRDDKHQLSGWKTLMDADMSQWDTYLSYRFKEGYDGSKPLEDPIGENMPKGKHVFAMKLFNDELVLRVSGEIYGSIITKQEYRNYHLKLKFKWGEQVWSPRNKLLKDTGILYHSIGPHGAEYWRSWMLSQEFQIMQGHIGDYWSQATSAIDIRAYLPEYIMNPVASLDQPFLSVGHDQEIKGFVLRRENRERLGQWNELELICFEGKSLHIVNSEVVMVLANSRYKQNGKFKTLNKGKIQLQSEAAEVFYKDIKLKELSELPKQYIKLFD